MFLDYPQVVTATSLKHRWTIPNFNELNNLWFIYIYIYAFTSFSSSLRIIKTCRSYEKIARENNFNISTFIGFIMLIANNELQFCLLFFMGVKLGRSH